MANSVITKLFSLEHIVYYPWILDIMNKRTFLKTSTALAGGTVVYPWWGCKTTKPMKNWAGNLSFSTSNIHFPQNLEEVQKIVLTNKSLRALGSKHSFSAIADSTSGLISSRDLKGVRNVDKVKRSITVGAGIRYGAVCKQIDEAGFSLQNLASLPHISIAGACATATHGSGVGNGCLATAIRKLTMVKADGTVVSLNQSDEAFSGAAVGLGALGIVTEVELDLQPTMTMEQIIFRNMPMAALENNFMEIMASAYSVSLFTDWQNQNINQIWIKGTHDEIAALPTKMHGAARADRDMHPLDNHPAESCTEQMGVPGRWYERLPHFKMEFTPSSGEELQSEYFVPIEHAFEAMSAIEKMHAKLLPHLFISEMRTIAADQFWMSPFYQQPSVAFHFTWKPHGDAIYNLLPDIESALSPYNVRPHWGKLFTLSPAILKSRIKRLTEFKNLAMEFDPGGKFRNQYLNNNIFS